MTGQIDVPAMEAMISPGTRAVAITHCPSQSGLVNPAAAVGAVAARHELIYLLDACQSVGQIDLDVGAIGCHLLSGTGRKFLRGPRGTGFLYVSRSIIDQLDPPLIDLHAATWTGPDSYAWVQGAKRFENWESNVAGKIGLARAVAYARAIGLPAIEQQVQGLAARFRQALAGVPGCRLHDLGAVKSGIVTFRLDREDPFTTVARLRGLGMNTSVSPATYAQLDLGARGIDALVRALVHYYNSDEEVARFVRALA